VLESTNPSAQLRTSQVVSDVAHMVDRLILQSGDPYFSRADPDLSTDPPGVADLATPQPHAHTRLQNNIIKPKQLFPGIIRYANFCATGEPESLSEALTDPKWKPWMKNILL
jgi:hypothetical protein